MEINKAPLTQPTQQAQPRFDFPTEVIDLPSKGYLYPEGSPLRSGKLDLKYMTAASEDILTNQSYLKSGIMIDKLLQSLIATPGVNYDDVLVGDKNAILYAARILGYGPEYNFKTENPSTSEMEEISINLTTLEPKPLDENIFKPGMKNEFEFTLPVSKTTVTFKLLTHKNEREVDQEIKGLKKIKPDSSFDISTRLKHMIVSVNGDSDSKNIRNFVDKNLIARDARALREYYSSIQPDINSVVSFEFKDGSTQEGTLPMTVDFFWPRS